MLSNKKNQTRRKRITNNNNKESQLTQAYGMKKNLVSFQPVWTKAKLIYCDVFYTTVTAGSTSDQNFRANSLFDPDRTGTGHQPRGYDQLTPMYNRYRVDSLKWTVKLAGANLAYNCCVALVNGAQTYTTIVDAGETNRLAPIKCIGIGAATIEFTGNMNLANIQGRSEVAYHTDDLTGALTSATPTETIDLHIVLMNPNATSATINYTVTLEYTSIFYDPILPSQS